MKLAIVIPEQPLTSSSTIGNFRFVRTIGRKGRHIWKGKLFDTDSPEDMAELNKVQPKIHEYWELKDLPITILVLPAEVPDLRTARPATTLAESLALQSIMLSPEEQAEVLKWTNSRLAELQQALKDAELAAEEQASETPPAPGITPTTSLEPSAGAGNFIGHEPEAGTPPPEVTIPPQTAPAPGIVDPLQGATFVEPPAPVITPPTPTAGELDIDPPAGNTTPTEGTLDAPPLEKPAAKKAAKPAAKKK